MVELTESGDALKDKALDIPAQMCRCLDLTEEETALMYKILYKVLQNVEKEK